MAKKTNDTVSDLGSLSDAIQRAADGRRENRDRGIRALQVAYNDVKLTPEAMAAMSIICDLQNSEAFLSTTGCNPEDEQGHRERVAALRRELNCLVVK